MKGSVCPQQMAVAASDAAALLKALSNERRLLILCHLIAEGEMPVGDLISKIGLGQSALSQHLAKLRAQGLVEFRRDAQSLFYRVCDERAETLLLLLQEMFCSDPDKAAKWKSLMALLASPRDKISKGG